VAQPPAAIARTFKPVGQVRLHRLTERARFRCTRCREVKTADLVATIGGNWTQTVCNGCYGLLVKTERQKAKKGSNTKQGPKATKQAPKKVKPKQRKAKAPQPMTKKERQQLERVLPRIDEVLAFFRAAQVPVELVRGGRLWINGEQTRPLSWILPARTLLDWNDVIEEMALEYAADKFARAVAENARFGEGLRAFLRRREKGFAVMRDEVRLAMIQATHAHVSGREPIHANFLMPGPHWQQLANVVHDAEPELIAAWKREQETKAIEAAAEAAAEAERKRVAARRRIDNFPDGLAPELVDACLEASRRIRLERQVAYERAVVLESDHGELTLLPIVGTDRRLLVPFRLNDGAETLNGELVLVDRDPLPLLIGEAVADEDAISAWSCALLGFADATCIELESVEPKPRRPPGRPRSRPLAAARSHGGSIRTFPRRRLWPAHLEPVGHWVQYSGSFVAGHRRRLNHGQSASAEARERARSVGINLRPRETWVQPHTRGVPDGIEMRFLWHAPAELEHAWT
jgi:hypothetical protein